MRRMLLSVMAAVALAGCGATRSTVTRSSSPARASVAPCRSDQLRLRPGFSGVAMGSVGAAAVFTNVSHARCSLEGYPTLQMLGPAGHRIATLLHRRPSITVPRLRVRTVTLSPGASASFYLGFADATGYGSATCPRSARIEVTPPDRTDPIIVAWRLQPYGGATIANLRCGEITVSPIVAGTKPRA
jgi:hypothetical protein